MSGFEFAFSLFGLLLGFSLVEVVAGFGRAVDAWVRAAPGEGRRIRVGWLSPLLGLLVLFNLVSFWTAAWAVRDLIPIRYVALLFGLLVTGAYYFAAVLVFPREVREWSDLDDHYMRVKRWVVGVIVGCNALGGAGMALVGGSPFAGAIAIGLNLAFYGLLVWLLLARRRLTNLILLVVLVAAYPLTSVVPYVT